jgi:hypothetical protein
MALKKWINKSDRGSLIPLSFGFFLISMTLIFISINISSAYAVKKQLTNVAEAAINKSVHEINLPAYYAQLNRFSSVKKVPLDCSSAIRTFSQLIDQSPLHNKRIHVDQINCTLYSISAEVSVMAKLPIQIPFFSLDNLSSLIISTQVGASSDYLPN